MELRAAYSAQTPELKTLLAGSIARALAVYCVDEVVVFDDSPSLKSDSDDTPRDHFTGYDDPSYFLLHILSYLESPPFLRTRLFPIHPDLRHAGLLPSLDMPHHLRANEICPYREGISVKDDAEGQETEQQIGIGDAKAKKKKRKPKTHEGGNVEIETETTHLVDVGYPNPVRTAALVPLDNRVTVHFSDPNSPDTTATIVDPSDPRIEDGYYWGYTPRIASSISSVLTECPFPGGYDITLGTSERGKPLTQLRGLNPKSNPTDGIYLNGGVESETPSTSMIPPFQHLLVAFGGISGLEPAVGSDPVLREKDIETKELFDFWVDVCPGQGSRTIRTEEAIWIALAQLKEIVDANGY